MDVGAREVFVSVQDTSPVQTGILGAEGGGVEGADAAFKANSKRRGLAKVGTL